MRSGRPGTQGGQKDPSPRRPRNQWVALAAMVGVLLAINLWASSEVLSPNRVKIPYSPTFLSEVTSGNVASVNSPIVSR